MTGKNDWQPLDNRLANLVFTPRLLAYAFFSQYLFNQTTFIMNIMVKNSVPLGHVNSS